jgi:hypothetical protein
MIRLRKSCRVGWWGWEWWLGSVAGILVGIWRIGRLTRWRILPSTRRAGRRVLWIQWWRILSLGGRDGWRSLWHNGRLNRLRWLLFLAFKYADLLLGLDQSLSQGINFD